ncbi:MAG TPA: PorV/PorQ family protein [Spirochaetota bacterium]|nr:PorV/PorQ family protein [Spirochaetota bacterium]HPJ39332.1 PorV/PorQ family protein [Spirochaetota bacterium]HPQ53163.1 PorV/PorQ family protein [Spirochaetota bacterium]
MINRTITFLVSMCIVFHSFFLVKTANAAGTVGTSGADFLEIGVGSRPLGMGEAFTGVTEDINSIYYNPAGLGTMRYPVLSVMHQELILDSRFENISAAFPVYNGFMGISSSLFWVPPFEKIDIDGNEVGTVYFYNMSNVLAYGISLGFMEIGGSLKYIYQRIDTLQLHSFAFDIGLMKRLYMYSPFDAPVRNFSIGLSIQNVGTKAKEDPLPRLVRLGASYKLTKWFAFNVDMIENLISSSDAYDFTYGFDESFRINTGVEFTYLDLLALRAGYRFNDAGTYSFGMGFNYQVNKVNFSADASYSDAGIFGQVYSFTVSCKLMLQIITVEDKREAERLYKKGIRKYVKGDIDGAIDEFESARRKNPYHKNIEQKIDDLKELKKLKKQGDKLEQEYQRYQFYQNR